MSIILDDFFLASRLCIFFATLKVQKNILPFSFFVVLALKSTEEKKAHFFPRALRFFHVG